jgi:uncharacterized protein YbjT (DUF2867 family)
VAGRVSTVLVTGASGFIGTRLVPALVERGHDVRAMTRRPTDYHGQGTAVFGDVDKPATLTEALRGVDVAYYLVHSLDAADFEDRDAMAAKAFGKAAAAAGVQRIIYLGGLGNDDDDLSPHLRSRREVEHLLRDSGVPVTVFRAAVVVGHGGISWELTRQLVARLPVMLTPRWVNTRTQPIALPDAIRLLVAACDAPQAVGATYEIGGPDVLRYVDMLKVVARIQNKRLLPVMTLPLLTPRLSSYWLSLVTEVDVRTARNLIDSMINEVVVRDESFRELDHTPCMSFEEAVRLAIQEREADTARR